KTTKNQLMEKFIFTGTWQVAKNLQEREAQKRTQKLPYQLTIALLKGSHQIQFHLEVDNRACDHRMRVLINTPN
ncbi:MAG TPA: hypothetical protein DCL56_04940, partial [Lactobacillus sp.]|nr:hypothetical protein [Lactobacillus sp.]